MKNLYDIAKNVSLPEDELPAVVEVDCLLYDLFREKSKLFLVRECYRQFFKIAKRIGMSRIVLSGTPGIGKSLSLLYIILRCVKEERTVCLHDLSSNESWLFANGTCRKFQRGFLPDTKPLDKDSNCFVLLKNAKGDIFFKMGLFH
jgi:hypothetical protein